MTFSELMKRIQLSPSRKLTYFEKYRKFIDKEKLFLEEMIRISYNLGKRDSEAELRNTEQSEDVTKEDIENYKRLFPENNLTGLNSENKKNILTGLNSERRKSNGTDKPKRLKIRN